MFCGTDHNLALVAPNAEHVVLQKLFFPIYFPDPLHELNLKEPMRVLHAMLPVTG